MAVCHVSPYLRCQRIRSLSLSSWDHFASFGVFSVVLFGPQMMMCLLPVRHLFGFSLIIGVLWFVPQLYQICESWLCLYSWEWYLNSAPQQLRGKGPLVGKGPGAQPHPILGR